MSGDGGFFVGGVVRIILEDVTVETTTFSRVMVVKLGDNVSISIHGERRFKVQDSAGGMQWDGGTISRILSLPGEEGSHLITIAGSGALVGIPIPDEMDRLPSPGDMFMVYLIRPDPPGMGQRMPTSS